MYERFTDRARQVMQLADREARRLNHEYVGTEHVLLGLVAEGAGVAANVLKNLGVGPHKIRSEVERIVQYGPGGVPGAAGRLPHTPRAKKAIEFAIEEGRHLNHNYVGTEHLLLGLVREEEGVAAQVLMNLGLGLERVREEVLDLLGHNTPAGAEAASAHVVVAGALADVLSTPAELTPEQLQLVRDRVRHLNEWKDAFVTGLDFTLAAHCREEAAALELLLTWYERGREAR